MGLRIKLATYQSIVKLVKTYRIECSQLIKSQIPKEPESKKKYRKSEKETKINAMNFLILKKTLYLKGNTGYMQIRL